MLTRTFLPTVFRNGTRRGCPSRELRHIHNEMNRLMNRSWFPGTKAVEQPPLNAWSNEDEVIIQAELPGFSAEEIEISVAQNILTLRGERKPEELQEGDTFHRRERWTGQFTRTLKVPFQVASDQVEAEFKNGVLSIKLPRAEEHKPKKISVKAA